MKKDKGLFFITGVMFFLSITACSVGPVAAPSKPGGTTPQVTLDTISPVITNVSPVSGSTNDSSSVLFTGQVRDNIEVSNAYYSLDGSAEIELTLLESTNGLYTFSSALTGLSNGSHTLKVFAVDSSGNHSKTNSSIFEISVLGGKVESPVITPVSGAYLDTVQVEMDCGTSNSAIRYTLNGGASTLYTVPVDIYSDTVVTAVGFLYGMTNSDAVSNIYTITHKVSNVSFDAPAGTYSNDFVLTLTTPTIGASIIYSTNGGAEWITNASLAVSRTMTVFARAVKAGWVDSGTLNVTYNMKASKPSVSPVSGQYTASFTAYITPGDTAGAGIVYSTDGGTTWLTNTEVIIDGNVTLLSMCHKAGYFNSDTVTNTYSLKASAPVFGLPSGEYPLATNLVITCATPGVSVYYTLDGSAPSASSILYTGPISLLSSKTVQAIAIRASWISSVAASASYTFPGTSLFNETNNYGAVPATNSLTGNGYDFSGLTNYMTVPASSNNALGIQGTVEALIKMDAFVSFAGIVHKGILTDFSDECYSLQLWTTSVPYLYLNGMSGGATEVHGTYALLNDTWYHIVGTWDTTNMCLYVNGVLQASKAHGLGEIRTNDAPVVIGAQITNIYNTTYFNFGFDGIIDTVNLYNYMMPAGEVSDRYQAILGL
ncbi:MAG: hypothetical protein HPY53_02425 [Brevinematales bacterium]|nr:hypothetical protein [Brevinematales bacterium]